MQRKEKFVCENQETKLLRLQKNIKNLMIRINGVNKNNVSNNKLLEIENEFLKYRNEFNNIIITRQIAYNCMKKNIGSSRQNKNGITNSEEYEALAQIREVIEKKLEAYSKLNEISYARLEKLPPSDYYQIILENLPKDDYYQIINHQSDNIEGQSPTLEDDLYDAIKNLGHLYDAQKKNGGKNIYTLQSDVAVLQEKVTQVILHEKAFPKELPVPEPYQLNSILLAAKLSYEEAKNTTFFKNKTFNQNSNRKQSENRNVRNSKK